MKKFRHIVGIFLTISLLIGMIPMMTVSAVSPLSDSDIVKKLDNYISIIDDYRAQKGWSYICWNRGHYENFVQSEFIGTSKLKQMVNNGDYTSCTSGTPCCDSKLKSKHDGSEWKTYCRSNQFLADSQCSGFAKYIEYVIFGVDCEDSSYKVNTSYFERSYSVDKSFIFHPGDMIRYDGHSVIVRAISGSTLKFLDCNYGTSCRIRWDRTMSTSDAINEINESSSNYIESPKSNLRSSSGGSSDILPPGMPSNPKAAMYNGITHQAKISWDPGSRATSYEVQYYSVKKGGVWTADKDYTGGTSYVSTGLGDYDSYKFRVRSVNSAGISDWLYIDYSKVHVHSYSKVETPRTCTSIGYTTYTCSCGNSYVSDYTSAYGHSYVEKITKEATVNSDGTKTFTCSRCQDSYTEVIPKLVCSHSFSKLVTEPTCIKEGYTTYTCSLCGYNYKSDYTGIVPHSYVATVTKEATSETDGLKTYTCAYCNDSYTEIIPKTMCEHIFTDTVTAPTCTAQGYTTHTCSKCQYSYSDNFTNPVNHQYQMTVTKEATPTSSGIRTYSCTVCGSSYQESYSFNPVSGNLVFTDILNGSYYYDAVAWAYNNNITKGITETTFGPGLSCTRGQVVTFLWRAMGMPIPANSNNLFSDVKNSDYYYNAVLWAVEQGITTGTSQNTFSPNQTCSNAHILTFLWRTMGKPNATGNGEWYTDAYNWAILNGITSDTRALESFGGDCPRCDVVTFLYRILANRIVNETVVTVGQVK